MTRDARSLAVHRYFRYLRYLRYFFLAHHCSWHTFTRGEPTTRTAHLLAPSHPSSQRTKLDRLDAHPPGLVIGKRVCGDKKLRAQQVVTQRFAGRKFARCHKVHPLESCSIRKGALPNMCLRTIQHSDRSHKAARSNKVPAPNVPTHTPICIYIYVCVCVCVCVHE